MSESLGNLKLDYVDLYLIHTPVGLKDRGDGTLGPIKEDGTADLDFETDHVKLWKAMEDQVKQGKAKAIGLSNFNVGQIRRILDNCEIPPANLQVEIHAYLQQKELRRMCEERGITVCAYGPLGSPGRFQLYTKNNVSVATIPVDLLSHKVVRGIAEKHGRTCAQILLRHLTQQGVVVIPKSVTPARIIENIQGIRIPWEAQHLDKTSYAHMQMQNFSQRFGFTNNSTPNLRSASSDIELKAPDLKTSTIDFLNAVLSNVGKHKAYIVFHSALTDVLGRRDVVQLPAALFQNDSAIAYSSQLGTTAGANLNIAPRLLIFVGNFTPDTLLGSKFIVEDQRQPRLTIIFLYEKEFTYTSDVDKFFLHKSFEDNHRIALATMNDTDNGFVMRKKCKFCNNGFPGWRRVNRWDPVAGFEAGSMDLEFRGERNLKERNIVMITDDFPPYTSFVPGGDPLKPKLSTNNVCGQLPKINRLR
ncbi:unnamed protein product [Notodromas monacha]|uniref:NADP-dependent oxidoreductase domain-containing protein n=1 Tax=Notodromas monacha TaxID=399045 RepID=A0A7R9BKU7_9CRUS|nr:unnamed protein product [Notodromas monacha]CAG0916239.1 unnamed protein product [Notodromas monacha]